MCVREVMRSSCDYIVQYVMNKRISHCALLLSAINSCASNRHELWQQKGGVGFHGGVGPLPGVYPPMVCQLLPPFLCLTVVFLWGIFIFWIFVEYQQQMEFRLIGKYLHRCKLRLRPWKQHNIQMTKAYILSLSLSQTLIHIPLLTALGLVYF